MTFEDIKTLIKKVCPDVSLESCTLQPTGSLRSKIVKNLDTTHIPLIVRKIDKKRFKGRMIFCKPFVPRTPQKEDNPSSRKNEDPVNKDQTVNVLTDGRTQQLNYKQQRQLQNL